MPTDRGLSLNVTDQLVYVSPRENDIVVVNADGSMELSLGAPCARATTDSTDRLSGWVMTSPLSEAMSELAGRRYLEHRDPGSSGLTG